MSAECARRRFVTVLLLPVLLVAVGCGTGEPGSGESAADGAMAVDVVAVLPLTGGLAAIGVPKREAMELVRDRAAALDPPIHFDFRYQDSQGTPTQGISGLLQAASGAEAAFVDLTTVVGAAASAVADLPDMVVFAGSAQAGITAQAPNLFRVFPGGEQEIELVGRHLAASGVSSVFVLHTSELYGRSVERLVRSEAVDWGVEVRGSDEYALGTTDFLSQLTRARDADAERILLLGYGTAYGSILSQAAQLGMSPATFVSNLGAVNATVMELSADLTEGMVFAGPRVAVESPADASPSAFVEDYTNRFGRAPDFRVSFVYDALMFYAAALQEAGGRATPAVIHAAMQALSPYAGVSGAISMDADRDAAVDMVLGRYNAGRVEALSETTGP